MATAGVGTSVSAPAPAAVGGAGVGGGKIVVYGWLDYLSQAISWSAAFAALYFTYVTIDAPCRGEPNLVVYVWKKLLVFFPEWFLITIGSWFTFASTFWTSGLLFLYVDLTKKPAFIYAFKIQSTKDPSTDMKQIWKTLWTASVNLVVVSLPISFMGYYAFKFFGQKISVEELPSLQKVLLDLVVFILVNEIGFYYTHRLFHHPFFYGRFHKKHHEWTAPIGLAAIYAHPLEHIVSNTIPAVLGPMIMRSHLVTAWLWYILVALATVNTHSGYHLPYVPSPEAHDFHHYYFNANYGVLGLMDYIHGTDEAFRKSPQYQRHRTYFDVELPKAVVNAGKM